MLLKARRAGAAKKDVVTKRENEYEANRKQLKELETALAAAKQELITLTARTAELSTEVDMRSRLATKVRQDLKGAVVNHIVDAMPCMAAAERGVLGCAQRLSSGVGPRRTVQGDSTSTLSYQPLFALLQVPPILDLSKCFLLHLPREALNIGGLLSLSLPGNSLSTLPQGDTLRCHSLWFLDMRCGRVASTVLPAPPCWFSLVRFISMASAGCWYMVCVRCKV